MAFEDVPLQADNNDRYWNPTEKGEFIEGNLCAFQESSYPGQPDRMILEVDGNREVILPGGTILARYSKSLNLGDYIRVIFDGEKPNKNPEYNATKLYKVQRDPDRFVEYEYEDEE